MTHEEFLKKAQDRYRDKVVVKPLKCNYKTARRYGIKRRSVMNYPLQAWICVIDNKGYLCPECGHALGGLFGSFKWAILHGEGTCNNCKKTFFQLYHYVEEGQKRPLVLFALSGFPGKEK